MAATRLLFPAVLSIILANILVASAFDDPQAEELGHGCSDEKLYTFVNVTTFKANEVAAFASLRSNISSGRSYFATSMSNKGKTDPVYALVQYRNYLTVNECLECFKEAEKKIKEFCPRSNGARIYLDGCFLRYENTSFFGQRTDPLSFKDCRNAYGKLPEELTPMTQALLSGLIRNASKGDRYAVGSIYSDINYITVYGLAQCWPSLTSNSCQVCFDDAQRILLKNCLPREEGRALAGPCFMRYATYSFFSENHTSSTLAQSPSEGRSKSSKDGQSKLVPLLVGSIGGVILLAVFCTIIARFCLRSRHAGIDGDLSVRNNFDPDICDYQILRYATRNFDRSNMLGKGGFGEVYKGILVDGRVIAVKKLRGRESTQAMDEFVAEVKLISSVRHRNLVRLLGCSTRGLERLLVYEHMSNNSLDQHLFGDARNPLSWEARTNIIVGTARGLAYLHEESNIRIIHRDIKAGNILLDENFYPKIADFGLAKFFPEGETHLSTRFGGTIGYTAPEYALHGQLTEKADVYSYGMVVLEIVSGKRCNNAKLPPTVQLLLEWAWKQYERGEALDIVDPRFEGEYPKEEMSRVITIALLCTQASMLRPPMSKVVSMLTKDSEISSSPVKPAFVDDVDDAYAKVLPLADTSESHGSISISLFPR